ncbi:MAG: efflux RND transporter permease subunit, partial [Planctomycetota bacterium]|nr:efflux RND transporter permease subunit [Planctomycetota bacterium]
MVISFLPVFALTGQEGKLFHPLAFTKTFALIGTAIVSITLVPAIIPLLIRGRLSREDNNWIVRSVVAIYRPTLGYLMQRPKTVIWLFVILLSVGAYCARHLGREFMPPLDEGSILDMPVTSPRASVTEVADDLKARDALLREMPEVEAVVGKGGRADTPTDPSPLDMVETIVNLRPREHWLKRKLRPGDARAEAERQARALAQQGVLGAFETQEKRRAFLDNVASTALLKYDAALRLLVTGKQLDSAEQLADSSVRFVGERALEQIGRRRGWARPLNDGDRETFLANLVRAHRDGFLREPLLVDVQRVIDAALATLKEQQRLTGSLADPLAPVPSAWRDATEPLREFFGGKQKDFYELTAAALDAWRFERTARWVKHTNEEIFYPAMEAYEEALFAEMEVQATMEGRWNKDAAQQANVKARPKALVAEFGRRAFLWPKMKQDLVNELDAAIHVPGWANIWTQPIINRVDMLATGVRTQIGILVYGKDPKTIQEVSNLVVNVVREIPGAADVVADQTVGKGYVEIEIDRERAARYGVNVADIQEIIEVALGGKPITTLLEGRQRFPLRLRYARDYRVDEESIRRILVAGSASSGMSSAPGGMGKAAAKSADPSGQPAVHLEDVAKVRVVEGPVMIKSENGRLRSYVQLNVRDRDIVGFVEEARRLVAEKVQLPEGSFLEWSGQFEHQVRARKTLSVVFPAVLLLIFMILYITYHDLTHALLMMLAVPGALAGGVIFQTIFGYNFSVAVWVGYIACFGMATETGIIMLVYLRDAIAERGGLEKIATLQELEAAIMAGAVHRLRPKLL